MVRVTDSMNAIRRSAIHPTPTGVHAYFDKIQFWVPTPLDRKTLSQLRKQCGRGGLFAANGPARFNARYRQRIELRQPSNQALQWLARRDDALINRVEITIDLTFNCLSDRDDTWEFLHRHIVRRWHGKNQEIRIVRGEKAQNDTVGTRYDAGGWASNKIVFYPEEHSRMTGELNCLHLEWHLKGLKAVRAARIESGRDLLDFNHRLFWQKRLRLYDVDRRRLGRLIRNRITGKKRRTCEIKQSDRYSVNIDGRTGGHISRAHETIQELIDLLKSSHRIHRALVPISNEGLLP
ncbi:MAG: hypothetical protein WAM62_10205 [Pseudolabrys sp.]